MSIGARTTVGNVRGSLLVDIKTEGSMSWINVHAMQGSADLTAVEARSLAAMLVVAADEIARAEREERRRSARRFRP